MRPRWVALTFAVWGIYTILIGYYRNTIMSRFYETLSDPNMLYGVIGPQSVMLLGFLTLMVLFADTFIRCWREEYYPEGGNDR